MLKNVDTPNEVVNSTLKILDVLAKRDNLTIFLSAGQGRGLKADLSTPCNLGINKKIYYTRLNQLIDSGLIKKSKPSDKLSDDNGGNKNIFYTPTTLGYNVLHNVIEPLMVETKNIKYLKMIDTLKVSEEFTEDEIYRFVEKIVTVKKDNNRLQNLLHNNKRDEDFLHVDIKWTYEEMVAGVIKRIELAKDEIMLASKYTNDLIINSLLTKSQLGVKVKVISDNSLIKRFLDQNKESLTMHIQDKNARERRVVVTNPYYPGKVERRISDLPFSMIIIDKKEVGIELIHANEPKVFKGVIFIRDEQTADMMNEYYLKIWQQSSPDPTFKSSNNLEDIIINHNKP